MNHSTPLVILATSLMILAPFAAAAPGGLAEHDRTLRDASGSRGVTVELGAYESVAAWNDDGEDTMPPGAPGAGLPERLSPNPPSIGDGVLVLDSRYMHTYTFVDPAAFSAALLPRNMITPGVGTFYAWYGMWTDLNEDGVIEDYSDGHARNEFTWYESEGNMVAWVWPSNPHVACQPPGVFVLNECRTNNAGLRTLGILERDPNRSHEISFEYNRVSTGYRAEAGFGTLFVDDGFLMTTWVMTVSNATFLAGGGSGLYDHTNLVENDQLRDVDRYMPVSPDVETAYFAAVDDSRAMVESARVAAIAAANDAIRQTNEHLDTVNAVVDDALEPYGDVLEPVDDVLAAVAEARETVDGIRADAVQSANALVGQAIATYHEARSVRSFVYPGVAEGIVQEGCEVRTDWCPFLRFNLASAVSTPAGLQYTGHRWISPNTEPGGDRSNLPSFIVGEIISGWWTDVNGDGWVGVVCDPGDPESWDAETNKCRDPYYNGWSHIASDYDDRDEFAPACFFWRETDHVLIHPEGEWPPGSFLVRSFRAAGMRNPDNYFPLIGNEVADLRLQDGRGAYCGLGGEGSTYTLDAILIPGGSHLVGLDGSLAKEYPASFDAGRGVTLPRGFVDASSRTGSGVL